MHEVLKMAFTKRALRAADVAVKLGIGEATLWRRAHMEGFPRPFQLTPGVTVWYEDEIDAWLASKAATRN